VSSYFSAISTFVRFNLNKISIEIKVIIDINVVNTDAGTEERYKHLSGVSSEQVLLLVTSELTAVTQTRSVDTTERTDLDWGHSSISKNTKT